MFSSLRKDSTGYLGFEAGIMAEVLSRIVGRVGLRRIIIIIAGGMKVERERFSCLNKET